MKEQTDLNKLMVPLPEVRMRIVELMKDGFMEIPLGDFLLLIQDTIRKAKSEP